ncbi:alpha-hydroxy acid oxidase [Cupriavidus necator]|uniref:alpha-hydroxy acid oxidase n=1 Tax=Cupriavidus necator TaxID=106590 RepID=UPI00149077CA|nr:alpha-hydroxy acid oxidase [Cupriavidus necator]MDQ0140739.1 (S)-mandelate dehydrogenase [Cupriavidus necator]NOV22764.1 alpha-hydroxy-acid oxidizing protein [Cupriavidus necator]
MLPAIKDYRELARRRLSRFAFDYLEGGAEDGRTLARNLAAYQALLFRPRVLRDVTQTDPGMEVFGRKYRLPLLVGPTGLNGLYWPKAEEALARAAHAAGLPFVMSTASTSLIEDVRAASDGDLWLQLYVQRDRAIAESMMARARAAGFSALVLTVDTMVHGKRDHDVRNGFRMPVPWTPRLLADLAAHPRWCLRMLRQGGSPQLVNLARSSGLATDLKTQAAGLSRQMDMALCWDDIAWVRRHWDGPVIIKGILTPADAGIAARQGLDGIVVSNHGGRQLEGAPSALEMLPAIVAAAGSMEVFVDGGVRRGADIAKALALGARGVLAGRAPLYGLAARGPRGVAEVLAILHAEFETTLRLLGIPRAAQLDPAALADDHAARLAAL